ILTENNSGLEGTVEYCTDLFQESSIETMIHSFLETLESMASAPTDSIDPSVLIPENSQPIPEKEKNQLLDFPDFQPVHQLIAETAEKLGGETAIYFQDQRITYRELNETANQLAHY